jgi:hypothetical protein
LLAPTVPPRHAHPYHAPLGVERLNPFERTRLGQAPHYLCVNVVASGVPHPKPRRPLPTKDGGTLHTIGEQRELRPQWQRVAKLIVAKDDVLAVSRALELALFYDAKLDVSKS